MMEKINPFIYELRKQYDESMESIDEEIQSLIIGDSNMAAITKFWYLTGYIDDVYNKVKSWYLAIYNSRPILRHFDSLKTFKKYIPMVSFLEDDNVHSDTFEEYKELLKLKQAEFINEDGFDKEAFFEYFVAFLLEEEGYNKKHWYFKSIYINEIEFMLDFLADFVEEDYDPTKKEKEKEQEQNDQHLLKAIDNYMR